jgi:hypothetical protein
MCDIFVIPQTTAKYRNAVVRKSVITTATTASPLGDAVCGTDARKMRYYLL